MRPPRLGIALGAAALSGLVGLTVATSQPSSPQIVTPIATVGAGLLGTPGSAVGTPAEGLPGWLLLRTLPDPAPAASPVPAAPVRPAAPAPVPGSTPIPAVLAAFPVRLPAALHLPTTPLITTITGPLSTLLPVTAPAPATVSHHHRKESGTPNVSHGGHRSSR